MDSDETTPTDAPIGGEEASTGENPTEAKATSGTTASDSRPPNPDVAAEVAEADADGASSDPPEGEEANDPGNFLNSFGRMRRGSGKRIKSPTERHSRPGNEEEKESKADSPWGDRPGNTPGPPQPPEGRPISRPTHSGHDPSEDQEATKPRGEGTRRARFASGPHGRTHMQTGPYTSSETQAPPADTISGGAPPTSPHEPPPSDAPADSGDAPPQTEAPSYFQQSNPFADIGDPPPAASPQGESAKERRAARRKERKRATTDVNDRTLESDPIREKLRAKQEKERAKQRKSRSQKRKRGKSTSSVSMPSIDWGEISKGKLIGGAVAALCLAWFIFSGPSEGTAISADLITLESNICQATEDPRICGLAKKLSQALSDKNCTNAKTMRGFLLEGLGRIDSAEAESLLDEIERRWRTLCG